MDQEIWSPDKGKLYNLARKISFAVMTATDTSEVVDCSQSPTFL